MAITPLDLPIETTGSLLTAAEWNALVAKVNELVLAVNALTPTAPTPADTVTITAVTVS
jgi:hypothetical protein